MSEAYIVAAARTAGGRRGGRLAGWHPVDLAAQIIDALIDRTRADPAMVDDVIMGCVQQAGEQSTNIGRNANRRCISQPKRSCPAPWTS
jgi:acetyl-CoA C-acetyltransferase